VAAVFDGPHATPAKVSDGPVFLGISCLSRGRLDLTAAEHLSEHDFKLWTRRVEPTAGDVVFSYETRLGEVALIPCGLRCCLGRRMALMRPDPAKIGSQFLLYYYLSPEFQELIRSRTVSGSTVDRILLEEFPTFPIRVPDLATQREVASLLGALDDKIELNRRMNQTLESMARAIFSSWFVDFDPVVAKAAGRQPFGMSADFAALFPGGFVESAIGPVPESWPIRSIDEILELNPIRNLQKERVAPYVEMANLPRAQARITDWESRAFSSGIKFQNGDVLVARITPCLEHGKTAYVDFLDDNQIAWGSTEYIVLRSKEPLPLEYAYFLARSDDFRAHAITNMTGSSGRQRVPASSLAGFLVVCPPAVIARRFGSFATSAFVQMKSNDNQTRTLVALREALLPKLMSGELRVGDAEKLVGTRV